ncbi:MAG: hypothetical protein KAI61_01370 [Alphaproteobacteria bacterium]|nr:hypothetical protein [Alphaproteobacteria bacterium]MCK5518040.1 hypothetical protein [Alphaproteobacteria bacterium]MCK5555325.1 hypothetical protein [Alphaproteobacteria bacterium]MCK5658904.1 hypothetical protein [Alphaproteobacteria bacterium]
MDKTLLKNFLKLIGSENDGDAVMGLRGAQSLFKSKDVSLEDALYYAADHIDQYKKEEDQSAEKVVASNSVNMSEVPECRVSSAGNLEIVMSGNSAGDVYQLPGESALHAETIAACLKDAIVVSVISKSRFKLKLKDIKKGNGKIVETILQAEYAQEGVAPVLVWTNNRGEVGALATVLRRIIADIFPELAAV